MPSSRDREFPWPDFGGRHGQASRWAPLLIVLAGIVAYGNSFSGVFVFDDHSSIASNPTVTRWSFWNALSPPVGGSLTVEGRPILNLSLAVNHALGGLNPAGYHAFNLIIHLSAGLVLFGLVRRTLCTSSLAGRYRQSATVLALLVALVWTVHPLQTESVTYIIQRAESLMGLFYLLTVYTYARGCSESQVSRWWYALSVLCCLLGMGTKEVMVSAPFAVLLYDRAYFSGSLRESIRLRWPVLTALFATTLWLGWQVVSGGGNRSGIIGFGVGESWPGYLLSQSVALVRYLKLSIWPSPLVFEYGLVEIASLGDVLPQVLVALLVVVGGGLAVIFRPKIGFPCFIFLATLAPTSLLPSTTQMIVEHRMYLALSAVLVLILVGAFPVADRRRDLRDVPRYKSVVRCVAIVIGVIAGLAFIFVTRARNEDYQSELRLWTDTVTKRPDNFLAHHFMAASLEVAGDPRRAIEHYVQALQIEPNFHRSHAAVGRLLAVAGREVEAEGYLRRAIALVPGYGEAHYILGALLAQQGRTSEALGHFEKAESDYADNAVFQYNYAHALQAAERMPESVHRYESAVGLEPNFWEARLSLANALSALDRRAEAVSHFDVAVKLAPSNVAARNNYANALIRLGRAEEALGQFRAAIAHDPSRADIHHNIGNVLLELGKRDEAIASYVTALRLNPAAEVTRNILESLQGQDRR